MSVGQARLIADNAVAVPEYAVFITPSHLFIRLPFGGGSATSNLCTANVTGGTGPFTYLWTLQSGVSLTITHPTSAITAFSYSGDSDQQSTYKCTVTDSLSAETFNFVNLTIVSLQ